MASHNRSSNNSKKKMTSFSFEEFKQLNQNKRLNATQLNRKHRRRMTNGNMKKEKHNPKHREPSKAPYNFISLNEKVVGAEFQDKNDFPSFSTYKHERYTGYININITTKTPLFIKGSEKKLNDNETVPEFFHPGDIIKIPGSSLRGMIRTLVEITSWSKFNQFDDKLLFYRGLADKSNLRCEYEKNMGQRKSKNGKEEYKFNAGYLTKIGLKYYIIPAKQEDGKTFTKKYIGEREISKNKFKFREEPDGKRLVYGGPMGGRNGKKTAWLINPPDETKRIEIPDKDIDAFKNDDLRLKDDVNKPERRDGDLLRLLRASKEKYIPCFYVHWTDKEGEQRISFGHTGYFRLAYNKTIGDHVPDYLKDSSIIDLAEAIFGRIENTDENFSFASRVFFEDAELSSGQKDVFLPLATSRVLSSPKPTTFQHYLEQINGVKTSLDKMNHWNSDDTKIRGYKLFWHKENERWQERKDVKKSKVHVEMQPIKANTKFNGKIRFENLSSVELGALLFVLDLPKGHYHKLGMGKPLGLGTIEIKPDLILTNRVKRYQLLFQDNDWNLGIETIDKSRLISDYENFMLKHLTVNKNVKSLWEVDRLKELSAMLNWENTKKPNWNHSVDYIHDIREFRERKILPTVTEFIKNTDNKKN